jgi:hypothetical protein
MRRSRGLGDVYKRQVLILQNPVPSNGCIEADRSFAQTSTAHVI